MPPAQTGARCLWLTPAATRSGGWRLRLVDYSSHDIRRVEVATGEVTTLVDSLDADEAAQFDGPAGIAISPDGSALFVADFGNYKIRRVEVATGAVTTIAGSGEVGDADGVGNAAEFTEPVGLAISADGLAGSGEERAVCGGLPQPQDPAG
uniref:SMP-30/Gluconolactonase/LRE-like region domain-containing protein n=1 Tax=Emiliania huxleyi TaxID=2903 RepID=A0A7S3TGL3_EMIHU